MGWGTSRKAVVFSALLLFIFLVNPLFAFAGSARERIVRSGIFVAHYSELTPANDVSKLLASLKYAREKSQKYFGRQFNTRVEVTVYPTAGDFSSATGLPWWQGAAWFKGGLHFQPPEKLIQRGVLASTARHEYAHVALREVVGGPVPVWLDEGFAAYMSGEFDNEFKADKSKFLWAGSLKSLDSALLRPRDRNNLRQAYKSSFAVVRFIHSRYGKAATLKVFEAMSDGASFELAVKNILKTNTASILKNCAASLSKK